MKKAFLTLALAFMAGSALATTVPLGMAQVDVDANGKISGLPVAGSTGAYSGVSVKAEPSSYRGVSVTASLWPKSVSVNVYSVLSQTATSVNVTTLAGVSAPMLVCLSGNDATSVGAAFFAQFLPSSSAPVNMTSTAGTGQAGERVATAATSQCWCVSPGDYLHMAAKAGSVTANVSLFKMVTQ